MIVQNIPPIKFLIANLAHEVRVIPVCQLVLPQALPRVERCGTNLANNRLSIFFLRLPPCMHIHYVLPQIQLSVELLVTEQTLENFLL